MTLLIKQLEKAAVGHSLPTEEFLDHIQWDANGLVAVVAQDAQTRDILMLAWANRQAIEASLKTGEMHYWSRSRQAQWKKGESSGQTQKLIRLSADCDADALVALVQQTGVACHTGRHSCFYIEIGTEDTRVAKAVDVDPAELYSNQAKS